MWPQFERRLEALLRYRSQYETQQTASDLFPAKEEVAERVRAIARRYGMLIDAKYGEPFVVKETLRVDDVVALEPRSL